MARVLFGVTVAMTAQAFLRDQLAELADRGWDVHVACADDPPGALADLASLPGVTVHELPMARPPRPLQDIVSLARWHRLVGRLRPDIVIASTPKAGLLATVAARLQRTPARVYHIRGLRAEGLKGLLALVSRASERIAIASATDILVDGPSLLAALREGGLLDQQTGIVLGAGSSCGVDTMWFQPPSPEQRAVARTALGAADEDFVVGFLGRLAVDKGVRELVHAASAAHAVDRRIRLALVGPVEDAAEMRPELFLVDEADWGVAPGATDDPRSAYWAFDVLCLPSYREGFPISPLEAQACGLPVITTDATGCIDSVENGATGLIVPTRNAQALQAAIVRLAGNSDERVRMAPLARRRAVTLFDRATVREGFVQYLEGLAGAFAAGRGKEG